MVHRRRERGKKDEPMKVDFNVGEIVASIEEQIKMPSQEEIKEYEIAASIKMVKDTIEQISKKTYEKAHEDAKKLATLLDKGDPKHLNKWGA